MWFSSQGRKFYLKECCTWAIVFNRLEIENWDVDGQVIWGLSCWENHTLKQQVSQGWYSYPRWQQEESIRAGGFPILTATLYSTLWAITSQRVSGESLEVRDSSNYCPIQYSLRVSFGKQKGSLSHPTHVSHISLWSITTGIFFVFLFFIF